MESCKCPLTHEIFEDPVLSDDGHTYERKAIEDYIRQHGISPITKQPLSIDTLKTNHTIKKIIDEYKCLPHPPYYFQRNIHFKRIESGALFQGFGKSIYKVEWINREGPSIILLKIEGAKANQEASFYVQLSCHPHIVRTFGFVQNNNHRSVMLLQERAPHGDLSELLREEEFRPNERVLWKIFEQICDAMICLADNGIVHGDLACRNVLVFQLDANDPKKNLVKLTDFGLTRGSKLYSVVSTPARTVMTIIPTRYAAPEILRNANSLNYTEKSDVYSMGVLMWEACSYGELPYSYLDDDDGVEQLKLIGGRLSQPLLCSTELWGIMNECWHQEPENRPDFQSLKQSILTLQFQQIPKPKILSKEEPITHTFTHSPVEIKKYMSCGNLNQISHLPTPTSAFEIIQKVDQLGFVCDCGEEYTDQANLDQHKTTKCQNQSIICTFCNESLPSSDAMRDHLNMCGNKTEYCANCGQFIRRAIFSYHLENNCLNLNETNNSLILNETDNSLEREDDSLSSCSQDSSQTKLSNIITQEEKPLPNWPSKQKIGKPVECEYCHNQFSQKDYINHKDKCPDGKISPIDNDDNPNGTFSVPCPLCNEPINLSQFLSHKKACSRRK